jgi:hypothetical protein
LQDEGLETLSPFALIASPQGMHLEPTKTEVSPQSHCDVKLFQTKILEEQVQEVELNFLLARILLPQTTQVNEFPLTIIAEVVPQSQYPLLFQTKELETQSQIPLVTVFLVLVFGDPQAKHDPFVKATELPPHAQMRRVAFQTKVPLQPQPPFPSGRPVVLASDGQVKHYPVDMMKEDVEGRQEHFPPVLFAT